MAGPISCTQYNRSLHGPEHIIEATVVAYTCMTIIVRWEVSNDPLWSRRWELHIQLQHLVCKQLAQLIVISVCWSLHGYFSKREDLSIVNNDIIVPITLYQPLLSLKHLQVINEIFGEIRPTCSCIGVSGSCTLQACQSTLPEFEVIGSELRKKFEEGCEVRANGHSNNAWISECGREYTTKDLIYRNTYDWCVADSSIGAPGVVGRRCDPNTTGPGSCESLCRACNRRPQQHEEQYQYQCNCHFVFCCEIRCSICEGEKTYYTCEWPTTLVDKAIYILRNLQWRDLHM